MQASKTVHVSVPVSTEVISGAYEQGILVITIDTRKQNIHQRLGLPTRTKLRFTGRNEYFVQEFSGMLWPIRYRVLTREGYYVGPGRARVHFTTRAEGLDPRRGVSLVLMRAAVLLVVVAGVGYRRAAWLLEQLFHVVVSKSALQRWTCEIADSLPKGDEMVKALNDRETITEAHFDEIFPRGTNRCVLVLKDEHGRILATEEVDKRDEDTVVPFLERMKALGLPLKTFYIDGCKAYYNAIRTVFGESVAIQYDYFHVMQNVWKKLWKWALERRREIKERAENSWTPWYRQKLRALAKSMWKNRYLLFKSEGRMSENERETLLELMEADQYIGRMRRFMDGVWAIFNDSEDETQAREALNKLKQQPVDGQNPEQFEKVISYLETHFDWMTAYLRHEGVKRNSLAESGMRVLRRLEVGHDGFRSKEGRENCLRIYQAIRYLGWTVHQLPPSQAESS